MSDRATSDSLAQAAIEEIQPGMLVGFGGGRTASRALQALGAAAARDGLRATVVGATNAVEALARELGLEVRDFATVEELDMLIDGADEIDREMRMLKGSGGEMARERTLAWASRRRVFMVTASKISPYLGLNRTLAIAVMPFGLASTRAAIRRLGLNGVMRRGLAGEFVVTENSNLILDVSLNDGIDLADLSNELHRIPGVVEHGLFLDEADLILVEHDEGDIERMTRDSSTR